MNRQTNVGSVCVCVCVCVYIHTMELFSALKRNTDICYNMNKPRKHYTK